MNSKTNIITRDGATTSPWEKYSPENMGTQPQPGTVYDCLIVGAGLTGLTAALRLQQSGKKTMIAEAETVGFGTTGGTTSHINTFADMTYPEVEAAFGEDGARTFAAAIRDGFEIIRLNVDQYKIDCDFEEKAGFIYAEDEKQAKLLDEIYDGTQRVGVDIEYAENAPVRLPHIKAVRLAGQAQFHPTKYLNALVKAYINAGGVISEHTRIEKTEKSGGVITAESTSGNFQCRSLIYATHIPPGINIFSFRVAPYRSYVIGVTLPDGEYPDALVYDMQEPYHYFRTHSVDGRKIMIVGGNDHKTGHDDPEKAFSDLEKYVRRYYQVLSVDYRWSSQYYVPVDGLPYVGQIPFYPDGIYCATGYNGNGMMLGTISGAILADLVSGIENPYAELFSTSRIKPVEGFKEFVKENADVAYRFVADRLTAKEIDSLTEIEPGAAKVVSLDGKKVAAYRDDQGAIHALNAVCTHAACIVGWNPEEKSWDCPCHGARYDIDGRVITGPATRDLGKIGTSDI